MPDTVISRVRWQVEDLPYVEFALVQEVVTIRYNEGGPVCMRVRNGEPIGEMTAVDCMSAYRPIMAYVTDNPDYQIVLVDTLMPDGERPLAEPGAEFGERIWWSEVEIAVTADGALESCTVTRAERSRLPELAPPDHCEAMASNGPFEPADGRTERRTAHSSSAIYRRRR